MTFSRWPLLAAVLLFVSGLWLYSHHINFPYYYHVDEPGKVKQILNDDRNFHHPLLMLNTVAVAVQVLHVPMRAQAIVEAGRWFSVVMSALAVGLLCVFGARVRGLAVGIAAGALLLMHRDVFELAHYFKEDPALLAGVMMTFVAIACLQAKRGFVAVALLGGATALAFSGKFVGIVMLPLALFFAWRQGGWRSLLVCLAGFVVVACAVNAQMLTHLHEARTSLDRETDLVVNGQKEIAKSIPHAGFIQRFVRRLRPPFGLFFVWGLWVWWRGRRSEKPALMAAAETAMVLFPFAFTLMLSFSAKDSGRYFHPCLAGMCYTAGLGLVDVMQRLWRGEYLPKFGQGMRRGLAIAAGVAAVIGSVWPLATAWDGFANDARQQMTDFIRTKLPANAVIMVGRRMDLPDPRNGSLLDVRDLEPLPQDLRFTDYIANVGSIEKLKAQGVGYVALSEDEYGRYIEKGAQAKGSQRAVFDQRKAFYTELFKRGEVLLDIPVGTIGTHNPPLRLMKLP